MLCRVVKSEIRWRMVLATKLALTRFFSCGICAGVYELLSSLLLEDYAVTGFAVTPAEEWLLDIRDSPAQVYLGRIMTRSKSGQGQIIS